MTDYGEHYENDEPTSMHIHKADRKYRGHKLAQAVEHSKALRKDRQGASKGKKK